MRHKSVPEATYRLQFHSGFRFADATALVDYFSKLGITDIYASPIVTSRKGSKHGYDVTDPTQIDPDIGSVQDFERLQNELLAHGMHLILDIVPNHMAASSENRWWMDVLENGSESVFASYFDIDWHPPSRNLEGKVFLPVLGRSFGESLDRGDLRIRFDGGRFYIQYFDSIFPLRPRSYRRLLKHRSDELKKSLPEESPAFQEYSGIVAALSARGEAGRSESEDEKRIRLDAIRERLQRLVSDSAEMANFVAQNIADLNGIPGDAGSLCALERLLSEQHFLLAYWQDPNEGINYRRFFAITDLVGVRVENSLVFDAVHDQTFRMAPKGVIRGVRIDHIDGLRDPAGYLNRLQERLVALRPAESPVPYVLVEKILSRDESLPDGWPVSGTTGYDYMNCSNGPFVSPSGASKLEEIYFAFVSRRMKFQDVIYEKKKLVMHSLLRVEMRSLGYQLAELAARDRYARNILRGELTEALVEVTARLPVYRTYIRSLDAPASAKLLIQRAIDQAQAHRARISRRCFAFLNDVLTLANPPHILPDQREERLAFVMRWQQFTGPIVAKGIEDTALYVYYPLLSLNEVGGNPEPSKVSSLKGFMDFIQERQRRWPDSLNATSTHDSKLGEDVRARLNVLSEIPDDWAEAISGWSKDNEAHKHTIDGRTVPDRNEEYLIYQAIVGLWPCDQSELSAISRRLQNYAIKAIREAMVHTRWTEPNKAHEEAVCAFVQHILDPVNNSAFLCSVARFDEKIAYAGVINSLGQVLLKIACPGVPDFYQGAELWHRRLVDPDNREPVHFGTRTNALQNLISRAESGVTQLIQNLLNTSHDGGIKLYVIWKALNCRAQRPELFRVGRFLPLEATGHRADQIISFERRHRGEQAITVIPRWLTTMLRQTERAASADYWNGTTLVLPAGSYKSWTNIFTGEQTEAHAGGSGGDTFLEVGDLLTSFPVALLVPADEPPVRRQDDMSAFSTRPAFGNTQ
jgi:(1->4)-alpha-D-glucan 1-alpha-D-glucosylmutase